MQKWSIAEKDIMDNITNYISHCTPYYNIDSIIKDNKLKIIDDKNEEKSKIFCKIVDKYSSTYDNSFCIPWQSIEIQLNKKILLDNKLYFVYEGTYGNLEDCIYLSGELFDLLQKSNFEIKQFINIISKQQFSNQIKHILIQESKNLFKCKVVKEKYNPPLNYLILKFILENQKNNDRHATLTIGFLEEIQLSKYVNKFALTEPATKKDMIDEIEKINKYNISKEDKDQIINILVESMNKYKDNFNKIIKLIDNKYTYEIRDKFFK